MGTSPETFARVKDILRKLDRSIDDARHRRLSDGAPPPSQQSRPTGPAQPRPGRAKPLIRKPDQPGE